MAVVGDEEDGAGVGGERVLEHIAARQVEMVGGLVEHEQVHRLDHRAGEREARAFATGEVAHHPVGGVTGEAEAAEHGPQVALARIDAAGECCDHGFVQIEFVGLVLMKGGDLDIVAELGGAGTGLEFPEDELQQGGLAGTVRTDEGDDLAAFNRE